MLTRCNNCFEEYDPALGVCPSCGYVPGTPAEEAIHMDPGSALRDRYIIGKVLGFGGFGVTYLAWDAKLEQKVAIKEYLPGEFSTRMPGQSQISVFSGDKAEQFTDGMHKFVEEARRLARFQNEPGIVTVFDSFEENNTAYIVMEYLEGETLTDRLKREGKIQEDEAVAMLMPLMESLEKVHAEGILHRDIAPDNIFLTTDGQVKLIDFGAARYATTSHSRSLTVIIKPGYSPEEQYRSRGDQGPHTDVYALGATLYKMITGVTPPDAMERRAKYEGQSKDILVPPQKYAKGLSLARRNAILNAMNVRIEDRTPDVATFIKELNADPPAKLIYGKIKKIDLYAWPLWVKILLPALGIMALAVGTLFLTGVIRFSDDYSNVIVMPDGSVQVPDVEGLTNAEAIKLIENNKLNAAAAGNVQSEYSPAGTIVLQDPAAGSYAPVNSQVKVIVSAGTGVIPPFNGTATVPYVIWDTLDDAEDKLQQAGLAEPEVEEVYDDNVPKGQVISADKDAGSTIPENSVLKLLLSKGPEPFALQNVVGMSEEEARKALEGKGLRVNVEGKSDSATPKGRVMEQHTPEGTMVHKGDTIEIVTSTGKIVDKDFSVENIDLLGKYSSYEYVIQNKLTVTMRSAEIFWDKFDPQKIKITLDVAGYGLGNYSLPTEVTYPDNNIEIIGTPKVHLSVTINIGGIITFGSYGGEPIEWQVLTVEGSKVFVISKYGLDAQPYNTTYTSVTWETCSLRRWLNNDFYNSAFSSAEKEKIQTTTVKNENNPNYGTAGGKNTQDKVFLLSIQEARTFFGSDSARVCYPTQYAKKREVATDDIGACWWWLRSPGDSGSRAAYLYHYGGVSASGDSAGFDYFAVRPALWYDLGS